MNTTEESTLYVSLWPYEKAAKRIAARRAMLDADMAVVAWASNCRLTIDAEDATTLRQTKSLAVTRNGARSKRREEMGRKW